jgi:hypothetical protein
MPRARAVFPVPGAPASISAWPVAAPRVLQPDQVGRGLGELEVPRRRSSRGRHAAPRTYDPPHPLRSPHSPSERPCCSSFKPGAPRHHRNVCP